MRIAVLGCTGRMGVNLLKEIEEHKDAVLAGGVVKENSGALGKDLGIIMGKEELGVTATDSVEEALENADALIDFTNPESTLEALTLTSKFKKIHMIGTTGFTDDQKKAIATFAHKTQVILAPNTSLGINVIFSLVEQVAKALDKSYDVEILEFHHRNKKDAPSGTALALAEIAYKARYRKNTDIAFEDVICKFRDGIIGARPVDEIGISSLRGGSVVGDHSVFFAGLGERIEIKHIAEDRKIFAKGAVQAALWAKGKPVGLYSMKDVIGL
ncbi:MAG: 4-hydroxy-tetrahydrodipicolinate reductase [Alphaproteobacteria bacterium]|jgi:4-hydroxy-tetrahydrodipicolinate reductase